MKKNAFCSRFSGILLAAMLVSLICVPVLFAFSGCENNKEVLNVFNWGEYIADEDYNVIKEFEQETGIKVNYTTYATNEEMYSKLKGGGVSYDIIIPSDYMINRLIKEDMLEKLNFNNIPNFENIMEEYKLNEFDPTGEYSVPYTWGTVVLIYNTKYVEEPDSWDALWDEKYSGKIIMFQNSRDAFGIALKKLGYSLNTTNTEELDKAAEELRKQKPVLQGYYMDEIFNKMGSEEAYIAPYYAGDALTMIDDNPDLAAAYPKEGTNRFVDSVCIPKGAKNKEAAEKFINFLCKPEVAAANSEYIGYSTPNQKAYELLDSELTENPITYPSEEILENTEFFLNLPDDINRKIDTLWTEIRGSSSDNALMFPIVIGILVIASVVLVIVRNKKKKAVNYEG